MSSASKPKPTSAFADLATTLKTLATIVGGGVGLGFVVALVQVCQRVDVRSIYLGLDGLRTPIALGLTGFVGMLLWVVLAKPSWKTIGLTVAAIAICSFAFKSLIRVESFYGNMVPKLTWRWTPTAEDKFAGYKQNVTLVSLSQDEIGLAPLVVTDQDYPGFLGQRRDGTILDVRLDTNWSARPPKELWRHPVGVSWASFAVVGNAAVTMEQRGNHEAVVCYNKLSGVEVWSHEYPARFIDEHGDGPRSTPTVANGRVFCIGATGVLTCLDGATGTLIWQQKTLVDPDKQNLLWGMSGSPLVKDGQVVVIPGGSSDRSIMAFDADTGNLSWSSGSDVAGYASPMIAQIAGQQQWISFNGTGLRGYDNVGRELWLHPWLTQGEKQRVNVAQPVVVSRQGVAPSDSGFVLVSSGYDVGCALLEIKAAANQWHVTEVWKSKHLKSKMSNFVVHGQYIYGLDNGILTCLSLQDGSRIWKKGRYGHGQLLLVNDVILIQSETGKIVLVQAKPTEHHELAHIASLEGKSWNHPALAGNILVVRNDREAVAYELPIVSDVH